jgi:hypothetical protein
MEVNPYESPAVPAQQSATTNKRSIGWLILRLGLAMLGAGIAGIITAIVCGYFLVQAGVPEPPFWLVTIVVTSGVLLPMGISLSAIGVLAWVLGKWNKRLIHKT